MEDFELGTLQDFNDDDFIYVDAFRLLGKEVVVRTTNKYIKDACDDISKIEKKQLINMCNNVYRDIISTNIDAIYNNKKKWGDFCDDVVLLHIYRYLLHNKYIPIRKTVSDDFQNRLDNLENQQK